MNRFLFWFYVWGRLSQFLLALLMMWLFLPLLTQNTQGLLIHRSPYGEEPFEFLFIVIPAVLAGLYDFRRVFTKPSPPESDIVQFTVPDLAQFQIRNQESTQ